MASERALEVRAMIIKDEEVPTTTVQADREEWEEFAKTYVVSEDVTYENISIAGSNCEMFTTDESINNELILCFHGGGYVAGSCITHRPTAAKIARITKRPVLVFDYPLAPEHPYPQGLDAAVNLYKTLLNDSYDRIIFLGDSAGGGLVLATLLKLKAEGVRLPDKAVAISPWTDMTLSGRSFETRKEIDPQISKGGLKRAADCYVGDADYRDPYVSPLFGDLTGLPKLLIHVGDDEVMLDDSVSFYHRAKEAGVDVDIEIFPEMWHVFHGYDIPEADMAIEKIRMFIEG